MNERNKNMSAEVKIVIDEESFQEAKGKLEELYIIAHAIRAETEKALNSAKVLEVTLNDVRLLNDNLDREE